MDATQDPVVAPEADGLWVLPGRHGSPTEVLARMRVICEQVPDLGDAMLLLLATHQGLPREILATATKQCRADLGELSLQDVQSLYISLATGGRQGFDAVLRSRKKGPRTAGAAFGAWVKD